MPDIDINASRLGWNIKCLREFYEETLSDLMNAIGANSTGPISYYESGKQIPNRDTLLKIAKHYKVTINELLYGDFSRLNTVSISDLQTNDGFLIIEYLLPIVTSPRAIENTWFLLAHKLHTYLFLLLKTAKHLATSYLVAVWIFTKKQKRMVCPKQQQICYGGYLLKGLPSLELRHMY